MTFRKSFALIPAAVIAMTPVTLLAQSDNSGDMTSDTAKKPSASAEGGEMVAGYDKKTLDSFVEAAMSVAALRQTYAVEMQKAESDEDRQKLAKEATAEMRSAVEDTDGITVDQYVEIGEASTKNEELNAKITAMVQERMPEKPGDSGGEQKNDG